MPTLIYADAYLKSQVTDDRETRAAADVAIYGTFGAAWLEKLTIIRAYIITCLECQAQPDDLFAAKLKHYRDEWEVTLSAAQSATVTAGGSELAIFSIPMERG